MRALILIDIENGLTKKKNLYNESIFFDTVKYAIKAFCDSDKTCTWTAKTRAPVFASLRRVTFTPLTAGPLPARLQTTASNYEPYIKI